MLEIAQSLNLVLRFALELGALASLSYWGFHVAAPGRVRTALGIATPLTAAIAWALVASPNATLAPPGPVKALVQLIVLGSAAAALVCSGKTRLAVLFGGLAVANTALLAIWQQ